jgi:hypothetical protein
VENMEGVSLNDLVTSLAPARIFIRTSSDVGSKVDIYVQRHTRRDILALEMSAWLAAVACFACFLKITLR